MDNKHYNILTIEDNDGDYKLVTVFLSEKMENPNFYRAYNYKEATETLHTKNIFDVVLLDLSLPDYSGNVLVTSILDFCKNTPVIILTGNANIDFSIRSISFGVSDYLVKDDLTPDGLYKSIIYSIERKNATLQLKESEERYSNLFEQSVQPMWVYDPTDYKFSQVNNAAIKQYGYSKEEFLNMTLVEIRPEADREKFAEKINANRYPGIVKAQFRHQKKSKEIINVEIYSTPIFIKGKEYQSAIIIDITEKLKLENSITTAIIKTQENERYEVGSELHDNVCQILVGTNLYLNLLQENIKPAGENYYNSIKGFIELAIVEIRNLSHRLAPAFFEGTSFEESFTQLLSNFKLILNCEINVTIEENAKNKIYNRDLQLTLYRILQEQLRNIQKYAKASVIDIQLAQVNTFMELQIKDNGQGFVVENIRSGIGLTNIKRRANLFDGTVNIVSSPGNGCILTVSIPIDKVG